MKGAGIAWDVEYTDEFAEWWDGLTVSQQDDLNAEVILLIARGPYLRFPHTSEVILSRHGRMRELRTQSGGHPLRVFYAFDPRRKAILLIGGDKTGNDAFYKEYVPIADRLYDQHLIALREEGLSP